MLKTTVWEFEIEEKIEWGTWFSMGESIKSWKVNVFDGIKNKKIGVSNINKQ